MVMSIEAFEYFGLTPPVTEVELKQAYRQRAHFCHPDKGGDTAAFQTLQQYYKQAQRALTHSTPLITHFDELFNRLNKIQAEAETLTAWFHQQATMWATQQTQLAEQLQQNEVELTEMMAELARWQAASEHLWSKD